MAARTRIKVCGMTRKEDVDLAVRLGVDALGFIFVKESPRYISPEEVKLIVQDVPPFVDKVGVFRNEDPALVQEVVQYCGLSLVQLHGNEPPEYASAISCRVVKAFRVHPSLTKEYIEEYSGTIDGILLDTYQKGVAGGTGKTFEWKLANTLCQTESLVLAGGLTPGNVGEAINQVRPFAVDVSSGVEAKPGVKDPDKVHALVEEIRKADHGRDC